MEQEKTKTSMTKTATRVNSTSDNQLVRQFQQEFSLSIQKQLEISSQIYLVDIL